MRGDTKQNTLFKRASKRPGFWDDLVSIRKKLKGVPTEGFSTREEAIAWFDKRWKDAKSSQNDYAEEFLSKYGMSIKLYHTYLNYLLTNGKFSIFKKEYPLHFYIFDVDDPRQSLHENEWAQHNQNYVRFLIHESATLSDAKRYLSENWKHIETIFKKHNPKRSTRIRISVEEERDEYVYSFADIPMLKMRKMTGLGSASKTTREAIIAKLVEIKFGKKIEPENVRRILTEQKKLRDS